jgi:DNA-binding NarL/FixJ family response regulator
MSEPIDVLLVEDHPTFRFGLRMRLEAEPDITVVGEAGSAEEAVALVERTAPDVAVVDRNLPGVDGVELIRRRPPRASRRSCSPCSATTR